MTPDAYATHVKSLKIGKILPEAVYLHRGALESEASELFN